AFLAVGLLGWIVSANATLDGGVVAVTWLAQRWDRVDLTPLISWLQNGRPSPLLLPIGFSIVEQARRWTSRWLPNDMRRTFTVAWLGLIAIDLLTTFVALPLMSWYIWIIHLTGLSMANPLTFILQI